MGKSNSKKYEVRNIRKSFINRFSDPEVKKGIGSALIFLGIVLGVMGITFTAVAFGNPEGAANTFPFAGPALLVVTVIFFVGGAILVRHEQIGCFKTRDTDTERNRDPDKFYIYCCFCQTELPLFKEKNLDKNALCLSEDTHYASNNSSSCCNSDQPNNDPADTVKKVNISGSLVSFSSLRNFKVHPVNSECIHEASPKEGLAISNEGLFVT